MVVIVVIVVLVMMVLVVLAAAMLVLSQQVIKNNLWHRRWGNAGRATEPNGGLNISAKQLPNFTSPAIIVVNYRQHINYC